VLWLQQCRRTATLRSVFVQRTNDKPNTDNLITEAIVFAWHVYGTHRRKQHTLGNSFFEILNRSKFLSDFYCHNLYRPCDHVTLHARIQYDRTVRSAKYEYLDVFAILYVTISVDFFKTLYVVAAFKRNDAVFSKSVIYYTSFRHKTCIRKFSIILVST
jgi:hypothetical protein